MPFSPSSPVTGATGFSAFASPTYTLTQAQGPVPHSKKFVVSAIGGTQTGVRSHSANDAFSVTAYNVPSYKSIVLDGLGAIKSVPFNRYAIVAHKGLLVATNQPPVNAIVRMLFDIPAGSESVDPSNLNALLCCLGGILSEQANEWATTLQQNYL
jgi:hypothetical protein